VPEAFLQPLVDSLMIKRMGTPEDHTGALLFLLSDAAAWMTGRVVRI
jgi:NAD(P)-dependent dehydrogenase (short-subunit alcohol dehydrogenase family)